MRLPGGRPKQYAELAGRPMLWHAVRAVCVPPVARVFVVLAPEDRRFGEEDWSAFEGRLEPLYCGGRSRRESVFNGLVAARDEWDPGDWILVHDAARPCVSVENVQTLIAEAGGDEIGAILAVPIAETVKKAGKDEAGRERVISTEDRAFLWLAQTPQIFRAGLLLQALQRARGAVTDESSAVEQLGLKPRLVVGSRENIKVTWPEDLAMAENILRRRAEANPEVDR